MPIKIINLFKRNPNHFRDLVLLRDKEISTKTKLIKLLEVKLKEITEKNTALVTENALYREQIVIKDDEIMRLKSNMP